MLLAMTDRDLLWVIIALLVVILLAMIFRGRLP